VISLYNYKYKFMDFKT